jgi:hypothetical protein
VNPRNPAVIALLVLIVAFGGDRSSAGEYSAAHARVAADFTWVLMIAAFRCEHAYVGQE